ncbi:MAG: hypothetical protein MI924_37855 [Chloroflexales bacterium]|nr:hypothetical protein [Chloroflexales bacterium]
MASTAQKAWSTAEIVTDSISCAGETYTFVALPLIHNGTAIGVFVLIHARQSDALFSANTWSLLNIFTLERMARTLDNLRNLYRPPQMLWQSVDLNETLRQVQQFTIRQFARHNVYL